MRRPGVLQLVMLALVVLVMRLLYVSRRIPGAEGGPGSDVAGRVGGMCPRTSLVNTSKPPNPFVACPLKGIPFGGRAQPARGQPIATDVKCARDACGCGFVLLVWV